MQTGDTIAAISSPAVPCARIILRVSGARAFELVGALTKLPLARRRGLLHAAIVLDELSVPSTLYCFVAPHSYSGEHLVELHLPGNSWLCDRLLQGLLAAGARLAEPGEFTARAYFNGRLDLTAAEGVAAAVSAASERETRAARSLLSGELARRLTPIIDQLAHTLALVEVGIDFVDEDVALIERDECARLIGDTDRQLEDLIDSSVRFERLAHEPTIALAGRPNAGKSTLLNALSGQSRAIVSPAAGTTRDVIWAHVDLPRGRVRMTDAAGVEDGSQQEITIDLDPSRVNARSSIHRQMNERARQSIADADVLVLVQAADDELPPTPLDRNPDLVVESKIDLSISVASPKGSAAITCAGEDAVVPRLYVSALTGAGMIELRSALDGAAFGAAEDETSISRLALNARHVECLRNARGALAAAGGEVVAPELIAADLRDALNFLSAVCGQVTPDDLLGRIFSMFCIGK